MHQTDLASIAHLSMVENNLFSRAQRGMVKRKLPFGFLLLARPQHKGQRWFAAS